MGLDEDALAYHRRSPPGKLEVASSKPTTTQRDLSLSYVPGVAAPARAIATEPEDAYAYTAKGNLVGVVSNGSAVLGLGDIGALASKPVMEGKGVLFKRFADIDVFDLELAIDDPDAFVRTVRAMEPTFGGINLEDIAAPECFEIEETLREELSIPIFHDDQHGTAIITGAALLNAAELVGKELADLEVVFSGAGAAATATARFYVSLGVQRENVTMYDIDGVLTTARAEAGELHERAAAFAKDVSDTDLATLMDGADVFVGLSVGGVVDQEMVRRMAENPIVFAMANPDPEIGYERAKAAREDTVIVATGRSDYPNQVNNVLCFPFLFRGALDVRAREIDEGMKVAAAHALADLAKRDVPDVVRRAYGDQPLGFGPDYLIPKPIDPRVLIEVSAAVAAAAMESGVARQQVDLTAYRERLEARLGKSRELLRVVSNEAKRDPKRVVLADGNDERAIRAAARIREEGIGEPILVGDPERVRQVVADFDLGTIPTVIDPASDHERYARRLHERRRRHGVTDTEARERVRREPGYLASLVVETGDADVLLTGLGTEYFEALRPPMDVIGRAPGVEHVAAIYLLTLGNRVLFCAGTTLDHDPSASVLAEITRHAASLARRFDVEPRAALLSYSNFGSVDTDGTKKPRRAARRLREDPTVKFPVDGEMQADTAVVEDFLTGAYEFCDLDEPANVLVFPNVEAGNIGYNLLSRLGGASVVGPILVGMRKPVHVLRRNADAEDVFDLASVAVTDAQRR